MITTQSVHDAYSDAIAARIERRRASHDAIERLDARATRDAFVGFQASTSTLLAHGAHDLAELAELARMCDVPRTVLAFDVEAVR